MTGAGREQGIYHKLLLQLQHALQAVGPVWARGRSWLLLLQHGQRFWRGSTAKVVIVVVVDGSDTDTAL